MHSDMAEKLIWKGTVTSVQPRIRLMRSFDQRHHSYLGYVLALDGTIDGETRPFSVAVGNAAHAKHRLAIGCHLEGEGVLVPDPRFETAELYMASAGKWMVEARDSLAGTGHHNERVMASAAHLAEHLAEVPVIVIPTIIGRHDNSGRPGLFDAEHRECNPGRRRPEVDVERLIG